MASVNEGSKRRRLGRGLDALLPASPPASSNAPTTPGTTPPPSTAAVPQAARASRGPEVFLAPIEELQPNRRQPRTRFEDVALDELAASLREMGMLEPILVRRLAEQSYEIIAGERRWRAAQRAGLHDVPVLVRELSDSRAFEAALVENLQREDLNPLEAARAFQRLVDEHEHTAESIATLIGKKRSTVSNALRLLKLPETVVELIESGKLSEGHGRALLTSSDAKRMVELANEAVRRDWSVRETERRARATTRDIKPTPKSPNVRDLEERLSRRLGTSVTVADRKGKGHLKVAFRSYEDLDRLLAILQMDDS
jgi:ParB family chromosome partitioning protein